MPEVPKNAKKPDDHKDKQDEGPMKVTTRGVEFEVEREAADDFELLDDLSRIDNGDASRLPSVLRRLLGPEQFDAAMGACRDKETGRVSIQSGADFVKELMDGLDPNS